MRNDPYNMEMIKNPYVASLLDTDQWRNINVMNNRNDETFQVMRKDVPAFINERIALLKLCDPKYNNEGGDELFGRRIKQNMMVIYLSHDEFNQLKKISRSAQ
jgi:hypothetical protein